MRNLFAVLVGCGVLALTGCAANFGGPNVTAQEVVESKLEVGKSPKVIVEMFNGGIDVFAVAEEGTVRAKVTKRGHGSTDEEAEAALENIHLETKADGDTVRIIARRLEPHLNGSTSAVIEVPPGAFVDLKSSNGALGVTGLTTGVVGITSNGGVKVKGSKGPVQVKTSNGGITAEAVSGLLELTTSNGGITMEAKNALVKAQTSNGKIRFKGSLNEGDQTFQSSNGGVSLTIASESRFKLDAATSNGKITSDFAVQSVGKQRKGHLAGTVGEDPAIALKIKTSNGPIEIKKN